jgi:hypothetical protein
MTPCTKGIGAPLLEHYGHDVAFEVLYDLQILCSEEIKKPSH